MVWRPRAAPPARPRVRRSRGADNAVVRPRVRVRSCSAVVESPRSPPPPRQRSHGWGPPVTSPSSGPGDPGLVGIVDLALGCGLWGTAGSVVPGASPDVCRGPLPARGSSAVAAALVVSRVASFPGLPWGGLPSFSGPAWLTQAWFGTASGVVGRCDSRRFCLASAWSCLGAVVSPLSVPGEASSGDVPVAPAAAGSRSAVSFPLPVSPSVLPGRSARPCCRTPPSGGGWPGTHASGRPLWSGSRSAGG